MSRARAQFFLGVTPPDQSGSSELGAISVLALEDYPANTCALLKPAEGRLNMLLDGNLHPSFMHHASCLTEPSREVERVMAENGTFELSLWQVTVRALMWL